MVIAPFWLSTDKMFFDTHGGHGQNFGSVFVFNLLLQTTSVGDEKGKGMDKVLAKICPKQMKYVS